MYPSKVLSKRTHKKSAWFLQDFFAAGQPEMTMIHDHEMTMIHDHEFYLVGGLVAIFFFRTYWEESSQLTFIFLRGVAQPPTSYNQIHILNHRNLFQFGQKFGATRGIPKKELDVDFSTSSCAMR